MKSESSVIWRGKITADKNSFGCLFKDKKEEEKKRKLLQIYPKWTHLVMWFLSSLTYSAYLWWESTFWITNQQDQFSQDKEEAEEEEWHKLESAKFKSLLVSWEDQRFGGLGRTWEEQPLQSALRSNNSSKEKQGFSLWEILESVPASFSNKQTLWDLPTPPRGNDMFVTVLCVIVQTMNHTQVVSRTWL